MNKAHNMAKHTTLALACALALVLTGCDGMFDYHPYDVRIEGETGINPRHIAQIEADCAGKDTLHVAVISDSHGWYTETKAAVAAINARPEVDFTIHCGDLTDCGTTKEFLWQRDVLAGFTKPYVALIGNHDFLGTAAM